MDGFRERLSGRYDRTQTRGGSYDRMPEDRYENDRYERTPRRSAPEGISPEALSDTVSEAVTRANREQLDIIADYFDEAKADRMESERAIIDALSHKLADARPAVSHAAPEPAAPIVVDEQNSETLARIERIAGQNAEAINESSEMLERNVDSLRSNTEILNEIKASIGTLISSSEEMKNASSELGNSIRQSISEMERPVAPAPAPMQDLTVDFTEEKNEIIGAVGDNRAILNMIRQDVLNGFAKNNAEEETKPTVAPLSAEDAEKYYKELEDHVHKECVKCYRNVQQALSEQNTDANAGLAKSVSGIKIFALVSMILNIVMIVLYVVNEITGFLTNLLY